MSKIAIVTDSTAGLPAKTVQKLGNVIVVPLSVNLNGQTFREGIDITNDDFYHQLARTKKVPTTIAPSSKEMLAIYDRLVAQGYRQILSIHLTSGITSFIDHLSTLAKHYSKAEIAVYDSHVTIEPLGYLVKTASLLAKEGLSMAAIIQQLDDIRSTIREYFVVDGLNNLVTGGRLTNAAAFAGNLFRMKPILTLNRHFQIEAIDKIQTMKYAQQYIEERFAAAYQRTPYPLHVMLTGTNNFSAILRWRAKLEPQFPDIHFQVGQIGPVVGTHLGPNAFVILWCREFDDLVY